MAVDPALVGFDVVDQLQNTLLGYVMQNRQLDEQKRQFDLGARRVQDRLDRFEARDVEDRTNLKKITQELGRMAKEKSEYKGAYAKAIDPLTETSIFGSEIPEDEKRFYFGLPEELGGSKRIGFRRASPRQIAESQIAQQGFQQPVVDPNILSSFGDPTLLNQYYPQLLGGSQSGGNYLLSQVLNQMQMGG
tara:strand:- start:3361 stop:3933 length:573 start_codon:yes stop_codon:yes gene_type:complete